MSVTIYFCIHQSHFTYLGSYEEAAFITKEKAGVIAQAVRRAKGIVILANVIYFY